MVTPASQAGLEVNDETELRPIPAKGGVDTMATESTSEEAMKASDVRFFWVEGGGADEDGSYHWCVDCPSLLMSLWYGGRLVSSVAPPSGAADTADAREILERYLQGPAWDAGVVSEPAAAHQERRLCILCRLHYPRAVASPCPPDMELCEKCGCGREMHTRFRSTYDRGCGMTWLEIFGIDADGEPTEWGLLHCCCDGYAPPAGAQPLTPSDFAAGGLSWRGD
jgi:hypothetical protein